jgi:hypothetical protein
MSLRGFPYTIRAYVQARGAYGPVKRDHLTQYHSWPAAYRKHFRTGANTMRQVLLHPRMGVYFRLKAFCLAGIFHDVFDCGHAFTHYLS